MPELPEVETVRRGLIPSLQGARIARVQARRPDLRFPLPDGFGQRLTGATVERIDRRAKYLLARLSTGETLVMHLGMTGRFEIEGSGGRPAPRGVEEAALPGDGDFHIAFVGGEGGRETPGAFRNPASTDDKHAHIVFETEAGAKMTYFDARRFGFMDILPTSELDAHPWFAGMGPEPLGPDFDAATLAKAFVGKTQNVKATLLDQRVVAGLGNIYVCEALFRARISPLRPAGRISRPRLERLVQAIRSVLEEAIKAGGSTLRDYAGADGALGYFQHTFQVYGREGQPCLGEGCTGVVRRIVQAGRSTFYCPSCQR
jgi:formamidopyrimidine-DNA glycosylase